MYIDTRKYFYSSLETNLVKSNPVYNTDMYLRADTSFVASAYITLKLIKAKNVSRSIPGHDQKKSGLDLYIKNCQPH